MGLFMQRYLILLLVISLSALNLSGCGNKGQPESSDDTKQNDE